MTPPNPGTHPESRLPRVLLIDDDAVSREVLSMVLEMHGFAMQSAEDGPEALTLIERASERAEADAVPEVILMDTQMPGLSGLELVRALRRSSGARIVAISGSEVSEELRLATDGFLLKPIEPEALVALLEERGEVSASIDANLEAGGQAGELGGDLVDPLVLGKLKAMMPASAVSQIYTAVATDLEIRVAALGVAMDAGDAVEVRRIAHAIKGGCAMVGVTRATEAASRLEIGNGRETWQKELLHLAVALRILQSIVSNGLPW